MSYFEQFQSEMLQYANEEKAAFFPRFFKTKPGEYGAGDQFLGVTVPHQRKLAKKYNKLLTLSEVITLLQNPVHEYRLTALFMLVNRFTKAKDIYEREEIVNLYLQHTYYVNNWDLVDSSADKILGAYLWDKDKELLYLLARSKNLWEQRIAIIATFHFIKKGFFGDTLNIAEILLTHPHDLIHKAVGWMLREVGKRNYQVEFDFLREHYERMPRTMLRYAIEKFPPDVRQQFLQGTII